MNAPKENQQQPAPKLPNIIYPDLNLTLRELKELKNIEDLDYNKNKYENEILTIIKRGLKSIFLNREKLNKFFSIINPNERLLITEAEILFCKNDKIITNFGTIILNRITNYTLDETTHSEIEMLHFFKNEEPKCVKITSETFKNNAWIEDDRFKCSNKKSVQNILKDMLICAPEIRLPLYTGWLKYHDNSYAFEDGTLINIDYKPENILESGSHILSMLDVAEHNATFPIISGILLSLVQSKMITLGEPLRTTIISYAESQTGKTTLLTLFGDLENGREEHCSFESTMSGILETAESRRDLPTIIDDCKPNEEKESEKNAKKILSRLIRICGDTKKGRKIHKKEIKVEGILFISAEDLLIQVASSLSRSYIIEMLPNSVDFGKIKHFKNNHIFYKNFIKNFIQYICAIGVDRYCIELKNKFLDQRDIMFEAEFKDEAKKPDHRTIDTAVMLGIGFENFLDYEFSIGIIDEAIRERYSQEMKSILIKQIKYQSEIVKKSNEIAKFFSALNVILGEDRSRRITVKSNELGFLAENNDNTLVFDKNEYSYLVIHEAYKEVKRYYKGLGESFSMSERAINDRLRNAKHIIPCANTPIYRLNVNKEKYDTLKFKKEVFHKLLNGGKQNESERTTDEEIESNRLKCIQAGFRPESD